MLNLPTISSNQFHKYQPRASKCEDARNHSISLVYTSNSRGRSVWQFVTCFQISVTKCGDVMPPKWLVAWTLYVQSQLVILSNALTYLLQEYENRTNCKQLGKEPALRPHWGAEISAQGQRWRSWKIPRLSLEKLEFGPTVGSVSVQA